MTQAERYTTLYALTKREKLDSSYYAAFYLLSSNAGICEKACNFVSKEGIDFNGIINSCQDLNEPQQQLLSVAHNLFSWTSETAVTPFDISRMGYPYMELVCNAVCIASGEYTVRVETNEQNQSSIILDTSRYERTKHIHENFESMLIRQIEMQVHDDNKNMER